MDKLWKQVRVSLFFFFLSKTEVPVALVISKIQSRPQGQSNLLAFPMGVFMKIW